MDSLERLLAGVPRVPECGAEEARNQLYYLRGEKVQAVSDTFFVGNQERADK